MSARGRKPSYLVTGTSTVAQQSIAISSKPQTCLLPSAESVEPNKDKHGIRKIHKSGVLLPIVLPYYILVEIFRLIVLYIMKIMMLPLVPLRHLRSNVSLHPTKSTNLKTLKREMKQLSHKLEEAKKSEMLIKSMEEEIIALKRLKLEGNIGKSDSQSQFSQIAIVAAPAAPPPPAMLPPPPPPPPPPAIGLKLPSKKLPLSFDSKENPAASAKKKVAIPKKGFDVTTDQILNIANRLRKTNQIIQKAEKNSNKKEEDDFTTPIPTLKRSSSTHHGSISSNVNMETNNNNNSDFASILRAKMKTRRNSLSQENNENIDSPPHHHNMKGTNMFAANLRKSTVLRSPGGTPLRPKLSTAQKLERLPFTFNTALVDKNMHNTSPQR